MSNPVAICSNALLMLGAQTISSFDDDTDRARLCGNLYDAARDDLLRAHPWNCCVKRVVLSPEVDTPAFDYGYQFVLPSDWLRTLQIGQYGDEIDYKTEGRRILCDESALYLRYVYRNEDEASWDSALINLMTLNMAARMAYAVTQSSALKQLMYQEFDLTLKRAKAADGQDDPPETLGDFRLLGARY